MERIGTTWLPFLKGSTTEENLHEVVSRLNELVAEHGIKIISVETVYRTNWLGRPVEPCGIRVWWSGEGAFTAQEAVQDLFDKINT